MKKYVLMLLILTLFLCFMACSSEPECPSWSAPQPIDSLLLGTWELVESSGNLFTENDTNEITFYENNQYIHTIIYYKTDAQQWEHRWAVSGNILVMPDYCNCFTKQFANYSYEFSEDKQLLHVKLTKYPHVNEEDCPDIGLIPLSVSEGTFKRKK